MPKVEVSINPGILDWVLSQLSNALAPQDAVDTLTAWREGRKTPTFHKVAELSRKIHIPFGYFFMETPPEDENPLAEYRTVGSSPIPQASRDLLDTISSMTDIQDWMSDFCRAEGRDRLPFVGRFKDHQDDKNAIVRDIRGTLGLDTQWYNAVSDTSEAFRVFREKLQEVGVLVMMNGIVGGNTHRPLNLSEFRAFTLLNDYVPLIFINAIDTAAGRLFSLAHETTHIWLGNKSLFNAMPDNQEDPTSDEQLCNAVAAELLAPSADFQRRWENAAGSTAQKAKALADYFKCSPFVIARRALDHHKITRTQYAGLIEAFTKEWRSGYKVKQGGGGNFYNTMGSRLDHNFLRALAASVRSGETPYTEAYRLTKARGDAFEKLVDMAGTAR